MNDIHEQFFPRQVGPKIMAELSFQFVPKGGDKDQLVEAWQRVFEIVDEEGRQQSPDSRKLQSRDKFGRESSFIQRNVGGEQLVSDFYAALTDIAFAERVLLDVRKKDHKAEFPSDPTLFTEENRKQFQGGMLVYRVGSKQLRTSVLADEKSITVMHKGKHVLTIERDRKNGGAKLVVPVETSTGHKSTSSVQFSNAYWAIRDGIFFSDTYPIGLNRHTPLSGQSSELENLDD